MSPDLHSVDCHIPGVSLRVGSKCVFDMRMTGQAIKTKAEDPTQLFALKLCLMQVCAQASPSLDARVEVEMRDVSEASLHKLQDKPTGASLESIDEGQQGPKEGEQDPKPGVQEKLGKTVTEQTDARDFSQLHDQRKLDQILRLVSDSYEKYRPPQLIMTISDARF
jgi:hypothetical protein